MIREIFSHFGHVLRVTVLRSDPLQVLIHFEHPISATALINSNGLSLGGRAILTRPFSRPTTPPRFTFDPFGQDISEELPQGFNRLNAGSSRLKADSQPFVPPVRQRPSESPPDVDFGSSPSNGSSNERKTSVGTSQSMPTGGQRVDRWHDPTAWCEWAVWSRLTFRTAHASR